MGRLIDPERRVQARQAREERMQRILVEADRCFVETPPAEVDLDVVGRRADVKAGLVSMYFGSREELFLAVLRTRVDEWRDDLDRRLAEVGDRLGSGRAAAEIAASLASKPELVRLLGGAGSMLEGCGDITAALGFSRWYRERIISIGAAVAGRCRDIDSATAARAVRLAHLVAGGLAFAAFPRGAGVLAADDDGHIGLDFEEELRTAVASRLEGQIA